MIKIVINAIRIYCIDLARSIPLGTDQNIATQLPEPNTDPSSVQPKPDLIHKESVLDMTQASDVKLQKLNAFVHKIDRKLDTRPTLTRWILAGPIGFILSILSLASLPHLLPAGAGGVNHLLLPVIFFPVLWSIYIIWPVMAVRLGLCALLFLALFFICVVTVAAGLLV